MSINVHAEQMRLAELTVTKLKAEYDRLYGEPTLSNNRVYLTKRILWRLQAQAEGDLSHRARARAMELANDLDLRTRAPKRPGEAAGPSVVVPIRFSPPVRDPAPGTLLIREYKGRKVAVQVLEKGFEYEGKVYRSLSAVTTAITGSHWNGRLFFGLTSEATLKEQK